MSAASTSVQWPSPPYDDRIRRNVACVNCRNSKVRCRANPVAGRQCQRCSKLGLDCVVDKSYKRVTKRSKLEELERELKTLKQTVDTRPGDVQLRPSRSSRSNCPDAASQPVPYTVSVAQPSPASLQSPVGRGGLRPDSQRSIKSKPSEPRTLGPCTITGEDVDWYFDKYFECFHQFVPVLRKHDPDECYDASPTLFWAILFVTCRRYSRHAELFNLLVEFLSKDIWTHLSTPVTNLEAIHALLLICAWPLPTIRFATDPSTTFAGVAMNLCMLLGLHTGRGSHGEFCVGSRQNMTSTDEEASSTWVMTCVLAQRASSNTGHPPPSIQLNDGPCRKALASPEWTELLNAFDIQKYLNKFHNAMAAHLISNESVQESLVASWEEEFDLLGPLLSLPDVDTSRFLTLSAQQEIQAYYFAHPASSPEPSLAINTLRAFNTARSIISAALELQSSAYFLDHAPHSAYRSIFDAACLVVSVLRSTFAPQDLASDDVAASALVQKAVSAVSACSICEGDLPHRGAAIIEAFWSVRHIIPRFDTPPAAWPNRLGAGITFASLQRFKDALLEAQKCSDGSIPKSVESIIRPQRRDVADANRDNQDQQPQFASESMQTDTFQDIDWSLFMDDFGWGDESVFMGLPT